ncbi:MAG: peptidase M16 [Armatimonadota bacterium]|uniref:peptidase M16 n=1 Tax=Calidithermus chliarophilus TaxID=52023 RepID=UPI000562D17B|nr:peptidase M16 [Calidithermus chliarophilus]MDR7400416.1 peptidase M16 [Armatimonadota bacterium]
MVYEHLENGLLVAVCPEPRTVLSAARLTLPLGYAADPPGWSGLAQAVFEATWGAVEPWVEALEAGGVTVTKALGPHTASLTFVARRKKLPEVVSFLRELLSVSAIQGEALIRGLLDTRARSEPTPSSAEPPAVVLRRLVYAQSHNGLPAWSAGPGAAQAAALLARLGPEGANLAIVGAEQPEDLLEQVRGLPIEALPVTFGPTRTVRARSLGRHAVVACALPPLPQDPESFVYTHILCHALAADTSALLVEALRNRDGLIYSANCSRELAGSYGLPVVLLSTAADRARPAYHALAGALASVGGWLDDPKFEKYRSLTVLKLLEEDHAPAARAVALAEHLALWGSPRALDDLVALCEAATLEGLLDRLATADPTCHWAVVESDQPLEEG